MTDTNPSTRVLLWGGEPTAADRALLEASAREFGLTVRGCPLPAVTETAATERPGLIGITATADMHAAVSLIAELHGRLPRAAILVAWPGEDGRVIRAALEAGANDVLSVPLQPVELNKALIRSIQMTSRAPVPAEALGDIITICGARGGLGATTVAVNLGFALARLTTEKSAIVDLDLQRGDVAAFLNLTPLHSLADIAGTQTAIDESSVAATLARHGEVFVLAAPPTIEEADTVGRDTVEVTLGLLRRRFRYTVVDTARTITGATLAAFQASRRILLLSDLSIPGVRSARRTLEFLIRSGVPAERFDLLVTEAVPGPLGLPEIERVIGKKPLLVIPHDAMAGRAMNEGVPLNGRASTLSVVMDQLGTRITGIPAPSGPPAHNLLHRLFARE